MTEQRLRETFPAAFVEHLLRPSRHGRLAVADGVGRARSSCGHDSVELQLRVEHGVVVAARFSARGCAHTLACASATAQLLEGCALTEARSRATPQQVSELLGGLDEGHLHCASLAVTAARDALLDAARGAAEPWRKLYRT